MTVCRWPEGKEEWRYHSSDWGCVCGRGVRNSSPSNTACWGLGLRLTHLLLLVSFPCCWTPALVLLSRCPFFRPPGAGPPVAGAQRQPTAQTLSAALKHKGSGSLEVFLGMFPVSNHGRSRSKANKTGKETYRHITGKAVCWQREVPSEEPSQPCMDWILWQERDTCW
jgi:hypothetical protein